MLAELISTQEQQVESLRLEFPITEELQNLGTDIAKINSRISEDSLINSDDMENFREAVQAVLSSPLYEIPIKLVASFQEVLGNKALNGRDWSCYIPLDFAEAYEDVGLPDMAVRALNSALAKYKDTPFLTEKEIRRIFDELLFLEKPDDAKRAADMLTWYQKYFCYENLASYLSSQGLVAEAHLLAGAKTDDFINQRKYVWDGILEGLIKAKKYEQAFPYAEGYLSKVKIYEALAVSLQEAGDSEGAQGALENATEVLDGVSQDDHDSMYHDAYGRLSILYARLGHYDKAFSLIERWASDATATDALREIAQIQKTQGETEKSTDTMQKSIKAAYGDISHIYLTDRYTYLADVAQTQHEIGETDEAILTLQNAYNHLMQNLDNKDVFERSSKHSLEYLALTQVEVGDLEGATTALYELEEDESKLKVAIALLEKSLEINNEENALKILDEFSQLSDEAAKSLCAHAGRYFAEKEDPEKVEMVLLRIADKSDREWARGQVALSRTYLSIRKLEGHPLKEEIIRKLCNIADSPALMA